MAVGTKNEARRKNNTQISYFLEIIDPRSPAQSSPAFRFYCSDFLHPIDLLTTHLHRGANVSNTGPSVFLPSSSQSFPNSFTTASMNPHYSLAVPGILFPMAEPDIWRCFENDCWGADLRRPGEFGVFLFGSGIPKFRRRGSVCKRDLETLFVNTVGWCCRLSYRYREVYCESAYSLKPLSYFKQPKNYKTAHLPRTSCDDVRQVQ